MGLMSLFKKKKHALPKEVIETATAEEAVSTEEDGVHTTLVLREGQAFSKEDTYGLNLRHHLLPPLKPNQISISGIQLVRSQNGVVVEAFIRNTLSKSVRFEEINLILLSEDGRTLAKGSFELSKMGEIPALSCMPWKFPFSQKELMTNKIPNEGWKIAFELKRPHQLDLDPNWENQLNDAQKEKLQQIVAGLPQLKKDEVNFMGFEAVAKEDGSLAVTVLIRNGSTKSIKIEQLPLIVEDADGDQVCQGGFTLHDFGVKANTTKPWTFIFPESLVSKKNPNLSSWKVYPPKAS